MQRRQFLSTVAAAGALCAQPGFAQGKPPAGPVKILVGFSAGGGTDILARIIANKLNTLWGIPVIVENKPGAAGLIAAAEVAKAPADGNTLMMGHINALGIAPALNPKLGFSPERDFAAIALVGQTPQVLVASPKSSTSMPGLLAALKKKSGEISFGSSGTGSAQHLALALFEQTAGVSALHIPYKGASNVMTDLLGGQIDYAFEGMTTASPFIKGGKVRALAQTGTKRVKAFPDVPTVAEQGYPGFNASIWFGLVGPAKMPAEVVARINADVNRILAMPDVVSKLEEFGAEDGGGTPQRFEAFMRDERAKWANLIQSRGIRVDA
ncbi:tripartite tricarboxylate transporter substrate binding protein [Comamonas sp. CMM03]|uniref:Bug family tripartite tricarboxylate transporter substrate binding protein n=1 Tax=Comamonas sp. CMM03 TaxID=2854781 RepID=UPI001C437E7E|nr:tripartite tricarboxylate transporter substrate binding protein [Comamonas sp. CMM03]MBV7417155.1 tripartite tricarboxylate transporter substrate binding protein [Comamonas sp. CMM03]